MSRIPIRFRVTLAFALAMAILLAGLGLFIYLRMSAEITHAVDVGLRSRFDAVAALVQNGTSLSRTGPQITERDESFAQVLAPDGTVSDGSPQLGTEPVLTPDEVARALEAPIKLDRANLAGGDGVSRLFAASTTIRGREMVIAVGAGFDDRTDELASLARLLVLGGIFGLLVASGVGYFVAGRALAPIEAMRRQASDVSAEELSERLELPAANDEVRRLGVTLNEMLARIEAAVERERVFVDDASHELRTPLALQRAELELALRHGQTTEELRRAISSALTEVDRVILLAEELLVVARADKGQLRLNSELVSLGEVTRELADRFNRANGATVAVAGAATDSVVAADRLRLEQALTNVIENAVRHGGGDVRITIAPLAEIVEVRVADRGPGFPPAFVERAFDRFARADAARGGEGVGLGLAIAAAIVEAHGGTIAAENGPDGGAVVIVELPLVAPG